MKWPGLFLLLLLFNYPAFSQQQFIKSVNDPNFGVSLRVLPASNDGWILFSRDSMNMVKYNSCGQNVWSKHIAIPNVNPSMCDIKRTKDGGYAMVNRIESAGYFDAVLTKLDDSGNILWSNAFQVTGYDMYTYTLDEDAQGNLMLFMNIIYHSTTPSYTVIIKTNSAGTILWSKEYGYGIIWGGAIFTSDNGIIARTGNSVFKTDANGNVQWATLVMANTYNFFEAAEVSDGYILTGYLNTSQYIIYMKLDKQGNILWNSAQKTTGFTGTPSKFKTKRNGNLVAMQRQGNYSTLIEYDKDINVVAQNSIDNPGGDVLAGRDFCFLDDGNMAIAGVNNSISPALFVKTDANYKNGCDVTQPILPYTLTAYTQRAETPVANNFSFNTINRNFISTNISISESLLCTKPKYLELGADTQLCDRVSIILKNKFADTFTEYTWSTGETTSSITVNQSGKYWVDVKDDCDNNILSDTITITYLPFVDFDLGDNRTECFGDVATLYGPACDSCSYLWSTGDTIRNTMVNSADEYLLFVKNNYGCISRDSVNIDFAKCNCDFYTPNAFSPNNDAKNEIFKPVYDCEITDYSFIIFNRWGQQIFTSTDLGSGWNGKYEGKTATEGVYVFQIRYSPIIKGRVNKPVVKTGSVALIR